MSKRLTTIGLRRAPQPSAAGTRLRLNAVAGLAGLAALGSAQDSRFEAPFVLPVPGDPTAVRAGDLDGDGRPDLAVVDSTGGRILLVRNLGSSIRTQVTIPLPQPLSGSGLELADLDGDGDLDVAAVSYSAGTLTVVRNDGAWNFSVLPAIPVGARPATVDSADLDGDALPELVLVHSPQWPSPGLLSVLPNLGGLGFGAPATTAATMASPVGQLADLDGDGDLDILLSPGFVAWNLGAGVFGPSQAVATGTNAWGAVLADLDGDGAVDIVEGSSNGFVRAFRNLGGGTFALSAQTSVTFEAVWPSAIDMDGDGDPDVIAVLNSNDAFWVDNTGGGGLGSFLIIRTGPQTSAVVGADLDLDGDLDVVAASRGDASVSTEYSALTLLWNSASGVTPGPAQAAAGSGSTSIVSGDLDGLNGIDVVVVNRNGNSISVYLATGAGAFAPQVVYAAGASPKNVALGDVDLDGHLDVVVASTAVHVLKNVGNGTFAPAVGYPAGTLPSDVAIGDVNGDGLPDLAVSNFTSDNVSILLNQGNGVFAAPVSWAAGDSAAAVALADLDGDLDLDLVVANGFSHDVSVLLNLGGGAFAPQVRYAAAAGPSDVGAADLDLDGDLDLVVVSDSGFVSVLWNLGNGAFAPHVAIPAGRYPVRLAVADFDLDGDPDIAVSNFSGYQRHARVLWNSGLGTFDEAQELAAPASAWGIDANDFDGDGDAELALALGDSTWCWYRNTSAAGETLCAGDGSGTACPCGNASAPGSGAGCLHSFGDAGRLRGAGSASLAHDTLRLLGSHMPPSATALYFQGTSAASAGAGAVFGDGLRCAAGTLIRLGTRLNAGGSSHLPAPGETTLRVRGQVTAPGERVYQVWYRNAASFCTASAFNLTNGLRVRWAP